MLKKFDFLYLVLAILQVLFTTLYIKIQLQLNKIKGFDEFIKGSNFKISNKSLISYEKQVNKFINKPKVILIKIIS